MQLVNKPIIFISIYTADMKFIRSHVRINKIKFKFKILWGKHVRITFETAHSSKFDLLTRCRAGSAECIAFL